VDLEAYLDRVNRSTERLLATLRERLADRDVAEPSLLPGWTRGHVLTHLARNADSHRRRIEAASRREVVDQYPGGYDGRASEINAGAARSAANLIADVASSAQAVQLAWERLPDSLWDQPTRDVAGTMRPARELPARRWQELEFHHLDLDLGYRPIHWPAEFVEEWLDRLVRGLPARLPEGVSVVLVATDRDSRQWLSGEGMPVTLEAPGCQLLAWLAGRPPELTGAPPLRPWA
jgi:maleylpyruvate isomerase